jgi:REP element-mobilizing transposase RayT
MSYVQILIHAVIRTYRSEPTLPMNDNRIHLYRYINGIIDNKGGHLYRINSMSEHVHLLFTIPPVIALSDFMRDLKASTSKELKKSIGFERFRSWGEGYAGLSYSLRDKAMLVNYIINQQEHHKTTSFSDEYQAFIKEMGLIFDERDWLR